MVLLLIFATFGGSLESQVLGGLVVLIVGAAVTSFVARLRKKRETKVSHETTIIERLNKLTALAEGMHSVLVGATPSDLNPNPAPGLVKTVPDLLKRTQKIEKTLFTNGGENNTILDRMDRLETKLNKDVAGTIGVQTTLDNQDAREAQKP